MVQVGQDGADAAWLLVQHADKAPAFQRSVSEAMEPLVGTGQVNASNTSILGPHPRFPVPERRGAVRTSGVGSPARLRRLGGLRSAALKWA